MPIGQAEISGPFTALKYESIGKMPVTPQNFRAAHYKYYRLNLWNLKVNLLEISALASC